MVNCNPIQLIKSNYNIIWELLLTSTMNPSATGYDLFGLFIIYNMTFWMMMMRSVKSLVNTIKS